MTLYGTGRALLTRRRRFVDTFDALLSRWQTVAGTLAVDGGALKASALGDWGPDMISGGEFTKDVGRWNIASFPLPCYVNLESTPGTAPATADTAGMRVARPASTSDPLVVYQLITYVTGATYRCSAWAYSPSTNTQTAAACIRSSPNQANATVEDAWEQLELTFVRTTNVAIGVGTRGTTEDDVTYFDGVQMYRRNAAAIRNAAPAFRARLTHISPAAPSVVPAGWMFRYTGPLDYWELRILPNTAGNDLQLVQVTAGAETVRAEADVDWTAEGTDEVELTVRGSSITTRYRKAGGVWTAGPSYASATQGAQSPWMGPLVYGTTTARWARVEVDW